jgi:ArsR family transcriptional regulator
MAPEVKQLWALVRREVKDSVLDGDRERCKELVQARHRANAWPDAVAGQMERHYSPGRTWEAMARGLFGLMKLGHVLDAGCGDGTLAQLMAPRAKSVTCLDCNPKMVDAATVRLAKLKNTKVVLGDVHDMPFGESEFDQALLFNILTQAHRPARVVLEAARVLRKGGQLVVITLAAHDHGEVTAPYGDLHPGFSPVQLRRVLSKAGLTLDACDITSREKRAPHFEILTAFAHKGTLPKP